MLTTVHTSHYVASGRISWQSPWKVLVFGGLTATAFAALYTVVIRYNPLVYLSFLATVGFGAALGVTAATWAEAGQSRSQAFNAGAGLVLGSWALWVHWILWTWLSFDDGSASAKALSTSGPSGWLQFLAFTSQHVHYTFGRLGSHGAAVSEHVLLWVWGIEAFIIVGLSALAAFWSSGSRPFSESARQWAVTDWTGEFDLPCVEEARAVPAPEALRRMVDERGPEMCTSLPLAPAGTTAFTLKLKCVSVPADPECCFYSLTQVHRTTTRTAPGRTKVRTSETPVEINRRLDASRYAHFVRQLAAMRTPA
jgi:hypothetical protein